jgi:hypothetical protein
MLYGKLYGKKIKYNGKEIHLEYLPLDFCPACNYFEDDVLPFCTKKACTDSLKVKLNGSEIEVTCPKQIEYILSKLGDDSN